VTLCLNWRDSISQYRFVVHLKKVKRFYSDWIFIRRRLCSLGADVDKTLYRWHVPSWPCRSVPENVYFLIYILIYKTHNKKLQIYMITPSACYQITASQLPRWICGWRRRQLWTSDPVLTWDGTEAIVSTCFQSNCLILIRLNVLHTVLLFRITLGQWKVHQLPIMIIYNGTWSILIQWTKVINVK